jgi:hypothetical protein
VDGQDYIATSGTLVFQPGETSKTFTVQIVDDSTTEASESFSVTFLNPENASKGQDAQITILDDDGVPVP